MRTMRSRLGVLSTTQAILLALSERPGMRDDVRERAGKLLEKSPISARSLTVLLHDGTVVSVDIGDGSHRVEYRITDAGWTEIAILRERWRRLAAGQDHLHDGVITVPDPVPYPAPEAKVDAESVPVEAAVPPITTPLTAHKMRALSTTQILILAMRYIGRPAVSAEIAREATRITPGPAITAARVAEIARGDLVYGTSERPPLARSYYLTEHGIVVAESLAEYITVIATEIGQEVPTRYTDSEAEIMVPTARERWIARREIAGQPVRLGRC